ncbi:MAG TPA: hypothetical protein PL064_09140, partial [Thermogutta sp.]|nr:hypothetical protein [Thermogutta sp.]
MVRKANHWGPVCLGISRFSCPTPRLVISFWKKGWFYALVLLAMLSVIVWVTRMFSQRKLKKEIETIHTQQSKLD